MFFKIALESQINVHLVRLIFRGRGKFISGFWSPFSISFIRFLHGIIKKTKPTLGRTRPGLRPGEAL